MDPGPKKRKYSPVWEHFDLITANKVKCLLCSRELGYNGNTSSMLRHVRALHQDSMPGGSSSGEKTDITEALIAMVVEDCLPFSIVEGSGFQKFVKSCNPSYVLPTRQALKAMVDKKYNENKEKAKATVSASSAVSLTSDMWTSINTEAFLAVTAHFVDENTKLNSVVLGVTHFPASHTALNLAAVKKDLLLQWGISNKVTCLVTDGAANMAACAKEMGVKHAICVAHTLNLIVKKALSVNDTLSEIRHKGRKIVGYFKSSTTAKERLSQVQRQMGRPTLKLIQEVETRWNSSYNMLQRLFQEREPVAAALAGLNTDISPLSSHQLNIISDSLKVLAPFNYATIELSEEKCVSGSKVIPMLTMLHTALEEEEIVNMSTPEGITLVGCLKKQLKEKLFYLQSQSILSLSTMLDPRFKKLSFLSPHKAAEAERRLTSECASVIRHTSPSASTSSAPASSPSEASQPQTGGSKLWHRLDESVRKGKTTSTSVTVNATIEVQKYLAEPNIDRREDPLQYWKQQEKNFPTLYKLAVTYLSTPASSVPCERIFSKAGDILTKKRNRLSPATLEKLLFLNKNQ